MAQESENSIRPLSDIELGEKTAGIIYNSVGTMRCAPYHSSELVSQALLGTPVKILEVRDGWRRVQTPDKYTGWINGSVKPMSQNELEQYMQQPKVIVTSTYASSYENPDEGSQPVSDLVAGNRLVMTSEEKSFYRVIYPDGREAFVRIADAEKESKWLEQIELTGESIVKVAFQFMGVPYLWGGTSAKGLDCSGFTKNVYLMHGVTLARDASQQVKQGRLIDSIGDFSKLLPGDLIFFGSKGTEENPQERVVHVGIYIGDRRFIHASDYVRVNSLDPDDTLYDEFNTNRYLRTKRIIGEVNTLGIEEIYNNPEAAPSGSGVRTRSNPGSDK